jgi:hypothetical protein
LKIEGSKIPSIRAFDASGGGGGGGRAPPPKKIGCPPKIRGP